MTDEKIKEFIEAVEANCHDEEAKAALVKFASEALDDDKKASALQQFINNFTTEGTLDPEIFDIPAYSIGDFYNDFIGNGGDLDPSGDGIVGSN